MDFIRQIWESLPAPIRVFLKDFFEKLLVMFRQLYDAAVTAAKEAANKQFSQQLDQLHRLLWVLGILLFLVLVAWPIFKWLLRKWWHKQQVRKIVAPELAAANARIAALEEENRVMRLRILKCEERLGLGAAASDPPEETEGTLFPPRG